MEREEINEIVAKAADKIEKFCAFEDIKDPGVIAKIRGRLRAEIVLAPVAPDRCYTEKELMDLTDKIIEVEKAVAAGLPNELYDMFINVTDVDVGCEICERHAVWLAHEGKDYAKKDIQEWADAIKDRIDRLTEEELEQLHVKMFLEVPEEKGGNPMTPEEIGEIATRTADKVLERL